MGKQEFASGGFTGRVGQFVGQRNGSGLILRTHVIPANPKTAEQQANRNRFAQAQVLTSLAMAINKGHGGFPTESGTEFRERLKNALGRVAEGQYSVGKLPMWKSYAPYQGNLIIRDGQILNGSKYVEYLTTGSVPQQVFNLAVFYINANDGRPVAETFTVTAGGGGTSFWVPFNGMKILANADRRYLPLIAGVNAGFLTGAMQGIPFCSQFMTWI